MNSYWKNWIFQKTETLIEKRHTPLFIKEVAWRAVNFIVRCGQSNPVSFFFRPLFGHHRLQTIIGIGLVLITLYIAVLHPVPAEAQNGNGAGQEIAPEGETSLITKTSVQIPLENFTLTQKFWLLHSGLDLAAPLGTPVRPVMSGKVKDIKKGWFGYGNLVVISHGQDFESWYGHLSNINAVIGQPVDKQTVIGWVGSTGRSTGPHLHLEIHENGQTIDPSPLLGLK